MKTVIANAGLALAVVPLSLAAPAVAQPYPQKPVRFLVGFPPGGTN